MAFKDVLKAFKTLGRTNTPRHSGLPGLRLIFPVVLAMVFVASGQAAPLLEEGFNYSPGGALGANAPWHGGNSATLGVVSGNLSLLTLREAVPSGNELRIGGGGSSTGYRNFSAAPVLSVAGTAVYGSVLINCSVLPTNAQNIVSLMVGGATSVQGSDDPLALYAVNSGGGYTFRIAHHGERATASKILTTNTTHLIVFKYLFGNSDRCAVYIDPVPGQPEPSPNAITENGEGDAVSNLQVIGLRAPALASQGVWNCDTLRVGTNWADVTPTPNVLTITGPANQAVCAGSPATLSASVIGTPPFVYQWRADGAPIANATNSAYMLPNPGPADTLKSFDVRVTDASNTRTSQVAKISVCSTPAQITAPPADQVGVLGGSATFTVGTAGDQPLNIQWRANGTSIPSATNITYTLTGVTAADALTAYDVVVANPCGSVTSAVPAYVVFPHRFFGCGALPGFFGGLNLFTTNSEGVGMFIWSCLDPHAPVPTWTMEGQLGEQPLNDGSGDSRYSINVNPVDPSVYYLIGTTTAGPYVPDVPVIWIVTDIFIGNELDITNVLIDANGVLQFPGPPVISQSPAGRTVMAGEAVQLNVAANGPGVLGYQWYFKNSALAGATATSLVRPGVTSSDAGNYFVIVTNSSGSATSQVAVLVVVPPPILTVEHPLVGFQFSGPGVPGDIYRVQATTDVGVPAIWVTLASGLVPSNGIVRFTDTNVTAYPRRYYRLAFSASLPTPPSLLQQPMSRSVLPGSTVMMSGMAVGSEPLAYQWYFNGSAALADRTDAAITLPEVQPGNAGAYLLVVTNYFGSVTSSVANLTLQPSFRLGLQIDAGGLSVSGIGEAGMAYVLQGTPTLVSPVAWTSLVTNIAAPGGLVQLSDPNPADHPSYFYRVVSP